MKCQYNAIYQWISIQSWVVYSYTLQISLANSILKKKLCLQAPGYVFFFTMKPQAQKCSKNECKRSSITYTNDSPNDLSTNILLLLPFRLESSVSQIQWVYCHSVLTFVWAVCSVHVIFINE